MHDTSIALSCCRRIAFVRSPYAHRIDAPHPSTLVAGTKTLAAVAATIEFAAGFPLAAYRDLAGFERIWLVFAFHRRDCWKGEVRRPRGDSRRSMLATRSPHQCHPTVRHKTVAVRDDALQVRGAAGSTVCRSSISSRAFPMPAHPPAARRRLQQPVSGTWIDHSRSLRSCWNRAVTSCT